MVAQADRPKGGSTIERMNGRPQPLFSNRVTHYFKEWATPSGLLKKIYCSHKMFDASVAVPKNFSTPKEN